MAASESPCTFEYCQARRDEANKKLAAEVQQLREEIVRKDAANSTIPARESQLSRKVAGAFVECFPYVERIEFTSHRVSSVFDALVWAWNRVSYTVSIFQLARTI